VSAFEASESGFGHRPAPRIVRAALGNDAGIVGAADLARSA
jgi:glucokinase